ncbi:MAG: ATP-binding protein, partial [Oscillospiraceae bacterium]
QLLKKPVIAKLLTLLDNISADETTVLDCYCDFVYELYNAGGNLSDYLLQAVLQDENIVVLTVAKGNPLTETLTKCLVNELTSLNELSALTANDVKATIHCNAVLPSWENTPHNITAMYNERLAEIPTKGYGIFAQYHMFTLDNDGNLL